MNKIFTTRTYVKIWFATIIIFVLLTILLGFSIEGLQKNEAFFTVFLLVYLVNIFIGILTFILGTISLFIRNKSNFNNLSSQQQKITNKNKPKTFIFYILLILIIVWLSQLILTNSENSTTKNELVSKNSEKFITNRSSCNKELTLQQGKNCTLRILRNDGGHGSGFVITPGYLITNKHVIEGVSKLTVWINQEEEVKVWNYSPTEDIAILKLPDEQVPSCNWFDSNQLKIAEELYTFGWPDRPTGESAVTKGIYSRTNRYDDGTEDIQTDAAINPGNSGGPLVNECGVVGINTARAEWTQEQSPRIIEGMSFALSSGNIHSKIDELINSGNVAKGIPSSTIYQTTGTSPNNQPTYTLNVDNIRSYLNDIYRVRSSWEQARGHVDSQKLDKLLDSFNRQIDFSNHLVNKLGGGQSASGDDINLWKSVVRMSDESAALANELNSR